MINFGHKIQEGAGLLLPKGQHHGKWAHVIVLNNEENYDLHTFVSESELWTHPGPAQIGVHFSSPEYKYGLTVPSWIHVYGNKNP